MLLMSRYAKLKIVLSFHYHHVTLNAGRLEDDDSRSSGAHGTLISLIRR